MTVNEVDRCRDPCSDGVPTPRIRIIRVQVVQRIKTGAGSSFDHVLITRPDDHEEIAVLFHPASRHGVNRTGPTIPVNGEDFLDDGRLEVSCLGQHRLPGKCLLAHVIANCHPSAIWVRMVFRSSPVLTDMDVEEGGVTITVPGLSEDGIEESVFYNPRQERNRDVTIAALRAFRERTPDLETYLDATAASGIRGARAAADGWRVTCCDRSHEAVELCSENLTRNGLEGTVLHQDVNVLFHQDAFDVIDLDPFGSPMPFLDAAVRSARALLCVTATDTAPLCGAHYRAGIRRYGAVPQPTEYHPEIGLRVLLSAIVRTAARHDIAVTPVLSHVESHSVRTYLTMQDGAEAADRCIDQLGFLWHCPECLYRETRRSLFIERAGRCPNCGGTDVVTAGPLWLSRPHDPSFVTATASFLDDSMGTRLSAQDMLSRIRSELDRPTHYDHHRLCKRWGRTAGPMDDVLERLRDAGFTSSRTHYGGTTFKTDAAVNDIKRVITELETTG